MITELTDMFKERLDLYMKKNNQKLPNRVLVYRDGVSEVMIYHPFYFVYLMCCYYQGQFMIVVNDELPKMIDAFKKFQMPDGKPYRPKLTIVICGKRHNTRFYPTDASAADKDGNPRPGTVVDRGVTAIYDFDFFLQAHGGLQGTTRPTHYSVVHDEIKFSADQLQKLTNNVSYTFARATKAVSLVSPAYYADLACERGRCYIHEMLASGGHDRITKGNDDEVEEQMRRKAKVIWGNGMGNKLSDSMFYL